MALHDPFGRVNTALPRTLSRHGRIELLGELAHALVGGRMPDPQAARWLGLQLAAWLDSDAPSKESSLTRDFLEVDAPARSTATPQRVWSRLCRQRAEVSRAAEDAPSQHGEDE